MVSLELIPVDLCLQVHVQNATLAGGVALGTAANMPLQPWVAMFVGCIAGVLSVFGYHAVTVRSLPYLSTYLPHFM